MIVTRASSQGFGQENQKRKLSTGIAEFRHSDRASPGNGGWTKRFNFDAIRAAARPTLIARAIFHLSSFTRLHALFE
ncbi:MULTISPECIES: hypothetical protein [unclassified Burkholderia]|uniref:hypothetical protein n=1 Tax=unclassified Burkholderia TaxID=2613784 RepID=UPI000B2EDB92|nr:MULTISPECIES: hypothetical protein [unclassified Burkholderia]